MAPQDDVGFYARHPIRERVPRHHQRPAAAAARRHRGRAFFGAARVHADIFDVRNHRLIRRGDLQTTWRPRVGELGSTYRNRSFRRGLLAKVEKAESRPEHANGPLVFVCELLPRAEWHVGLKWLPRS